MGASICHGACWAWLGTTPDKAVQLRKLAAAKRGLVRRIEDRGDGQRRNAMLSCLMDDGRRLVDFVHFLRDKGRQKSILDVWALELAMSAATRAGDEQYVACCVAVVDRLAGAWQEYLHSPIGAQNFDDAREWKQHDPPSTRIMRLVHGDWADMPMFSSSAVDGEQDNTSEEMYSFALAVMVGVNVAAKCSFLLAEALIDIVQSEDLELPVCFEERFPMLKLADCQQRHVRTLRAPPGGSAYSPKTVLPEEFQIQEVCPEYFHALREAAGIDLNSFVESVCRTDFSFISFGTNSKSNEFFFRTWDYKYLIKTTTSVEADVLASMVQEYLARLCSEPQSLLGRYLGLYRLHYKRQSKLFLVMRSVTTHQRPIHKTFDLKGSWRGRKAKENDSVGKDVNFFGSPYADLGVSSDVARRLVEVHRGDLALLRKFRIMDFSLLLQVHDPNGNHVRTVPFKHVELRPGAQSSNWFQVANSRISMQSAVKYLDGTKFFGFSSASRTAWTPGSGVKRRDGEVIYTMGLIDMLVPYDWYPLLQYWSTQLITCGGADTASRIPPESYTERQAELFHGICFGEG